MNDNPYQTPAEPLTTPTSVDRESKPKRPTGLTIWSWLLILNTLRHILVLWFHDGFPEIPIDALVLK